MMKAFDLVVVGGGIIGSMAAYQAVRTKPEWRTLLLDRSLVAGGATRFSLGLDLPFGDTPEKVALARRSAELYRRLQDELPDLKVRSLPFYGLVERRRLQSIQAGFAIGEPREADGAERQWLLRRCPLQLVDPQQVLLVGGRCTHASPAQTVQSLVAAFRQGGGQLWEGAEACQVAPQGSVLGIHLSDGRRVLGHRVLVSTGPWIVKGISRTEAALSGVRVKKIVSLHLDARPAEDAPVVFLFDHDAFLLPVPGCLEWRFSFTCQEWDCPPEVARLRIRSEDRRQALALLDRFCPDWSERATGGRVFCDAYSEDRVPIVRRIGGLQNLLIAGCGSGSGYRLAPAIAEQALKGLSGFPAPALPNLASR